MGGHGFLYATGAMVGVLLITNELFAFCFIILLVRLSYKQKNKRLLFFLCFIVILFASRTYVFHLHNQSQLQGNEQVFQVRINGLPVIDGDHLSFQALLESGEKLQVRYRMRTYEEKKMLSELKPGMRCLFTGSLNKPDGQRNPGGFDYATYLYEQAIHWIVSAKKIDQCVDSSVSLFESLQRYRFMSLEKMSSYYASHSLGVAKALLFGERKQINKEALAAYQTLGLIHVLVVSGLHVGVITASLYWCLLRIGFTRERTTIYLLAFLPVYVILTGAAPSVLRAAMMTAIVLLGLRLKMKLHPLDSICLAFLLIVFYQPNYLFQVGFQLSFIISFSLIVSWQTIQTFLTGYFTRLLAVSCIAQLASLPLIIYYFSHFSLWSMLVNVVFVPIFTVLILPFSFVSYFAIVTLPVFAEKLIHVYDEVIFFVHAILKFITTLPLATIITGQPPPIVIFIYYATIFYFFSHFSRQKKLTMDHSWALLPFLALLFLQLIFPYFNPNGKVTMLDVGQGDSIIIELPYRKAVYMIDTGGLLTYFEEEPWQKRGNHFDVGEDIVLPALKAKGIRQIDKLIITHGHVDHYGGTDALYESIKIKQLLYGKSNDFEEDEMALLEKAHRHSVQITLVGKGMSWSEGDYRFYILAPEGNEQSKNNRSIVLFTELGGLSWLFMGDVEQESERKLLRNYPNLRANVLKVGHHGSKTSTTEAFINQVQPHVALISAGRNNLYGHPHHEVVTRLDSLRIQIFQTDEQGAVTYVFSNRSETGVFTTY